MPHLHLSEYQKRTTWSVENNDWITRIEKFNDMRDELTLRAFANEDAPSSPTLQPFGCEKQ